MTDRKSSIPDGDQTCRMRDSSGSHSDDVRKRFRDARQDDSPDPEDNGNGTSGNPLHGLKDISLRRLLRTRAFYLFIACILLFLFAVSYYTNTLHPSFLMQIALKEAETQNYGKAVLISDELRRRGHVDSADTIISAMVEIGVASSLSGDMPAAMLCIDALRSGGFDEQADEILEVYQAEIDRQTDVSPDSAGSLP